MSAQPAAPFTMSMKRFADDDIPTSVENFYAISDTTVVFNANLVESVTVSPITPTEVSVRINNHDGMCIDQAFYIVNDHVSDRLPSLIPVTSTAESHVV
jgi:hypothetical protein